MAAAVTKGHAGDLLRCSFFGRPELGGILHMCLSEGEKLIVLLISDQRLRPANVDIVDTGDMLLWMCVLSRLVYLAYLNDKKNIGLQCCTVCLKICYFSRGLASQASDVYTLFCPVTCCMIHYVVITSNCYAYAWLLPWYNVLSNKTLFYQTC